MANVIPCRGYCKKSYPASELEDMRGPLPGDGPIWMCVKCAEKSNAEQDGIVSDQPQTQDQVWMIAIARALENEALKLRKQANNKESAFDCCQKLRHRINQLLLAIDKIENTFERE